MTVLSCRRCGCWWLCEAKLDSLWPLSQGDLTALPSPAQLQSAQDDGFSHLIVWRAGFDVLQQAGIGIDRERTIRALRRRLGAPVVADDQLVAWELGQ